MKNDSNVIRDQRQIDGTAWAYKCFPRDEVDSLPQRGLRFVEEAIELCQTLLVPQQKILAALVHVYSKPIGVASQELGGAGLTLLVLASAMHVSADRAEELELDRVRALPPSHFKMRNDAKNAAGLWVNMELAKQEKIEDSLLATANAIAIQLQAQRDLVAQYKTKFGEL
jgi:hypothetical protein